LLCLDFVEDLPALECVDQRVHAKELVFVVHDGFWWLKT
jgi:hypothetical protein